MSEELINAKNIAFTYLDEINGNIEIRKAYSSVIVSQSSVIFGAIGGDRYARDCLTAALKYKETDPNSFYKPLIVQINGIFENYIRSLVKIVIEEKFETVENYSCLKSGFRNNHISYAAKILSLIKSGSVMGAAYNFDVLLKNLGNSLSGQKGFKLNHEIYTILMGNCTSARITDLFDAISLPNPFSDDLGKNLQLKSYFEDKAKGRVAIRAYETLDKKIDLRNEIVHGNLIRTVNLSELEESMKFFRAMISALDELVRNHNFLAPDE